MPREFQRTERVADFIQRELATLISRELRDPRIHLVDVVDVEVSSDLGSAKVFVTFPGESTEEQDKERAEVLNGAAGFIRSQLAKVSTMRNTPRLKFIYDDSVRRGSHISQLIDKALAKDRYQHAPESDQDPDGSD